MLIADGLLTATENSTNSGVDWPLIISALALAVAATTLLAQVVFFLRTGARVRLDLVPAIYTHRGDVLRPSFVGWKEIQSLRASRFNPDSDLWVECYEIRVANRGRLPVTVYDVGLRFRDAGRADRDCAISLRPIEVGDGEKSASRRRIEPGESATFIAPAWPAIRWAFTNLNSKELSVSGTCIAGGHRKRTESSRDQSWKVTADQEVLAESVPPTKRAQVFQALTDVWPSSDVSGLYDAYLEVWNELGPDSRDAPPRPDDPPEPSLVTVIEQSVGLDAVAAMNLHAALTELMKEPSPARRAEDPI